MNEQHRLMRICEDMFYDTIASFRFRIRETVKKAITLRVIDRMNQVAFFLVAKCFAVAYEKLKVARVGLIDVWIINLVHDAMTQCEPNTAARMIGCPHAFFGARSPARLDSRRAKCDSMLRRIHGKAQRSPMNPPENSIAFGAPGIEPRWTSSTKEGVGTAYHTSCRVWFTLSHGIVNEIYYP